VEPQHWQWMNAKWNKWNLSLNIRTVFHTWQFLQRSLSLLQVSIIPSPTAWGKVCGKWISHMLISDQRTMHVLATTHLQHWRNTGSAFLDHILMVDRSWILPFDPQLTWQNADWHTPSLRKTAQRSQRALKVTHIVFSRRNGLVLDHPMPFGIMVSGWYDCPLLQDKVRLAVHHEQPELLEHGVILLLESTMPHFHHDVQILMHCWCGEVLTHPPYSPGLTSCDYWLFACAKEHCHRKWFELEMISTLLSLPLYTISGRTITELQLIIYHVDGKSVWRVLMITLHRRDMYRHSGISVLLLSCVLLLQ
jgi:hypothetical protein